MEHIRDHKDLIGLLLGPVRKWPGMYLQEAKLSNLAIFLTGYEMCLHMADGKDNFFGDDGFIQWFLKKYNLGQPSSWQTSFLDQANNDEGQALNLFFQNLEQYSIEANLNS